MGLRVFSTVFVLLFGCSLPFNFVHCIDLESAKESPCFSITKTVPVDLDWVESVKTWYYPLMSRIDLYKDGIDLSGKSAKDIQENELYYDSCITFSSSDGKFMSTSFGGKRHVFSTKPIKGMEIYEYTMPSGGGGTAYTTLTDNKTFIFNPGCMDDNQMSWGVISTEKSLPTETVKLIHDHAQSLGFKKEFFTGLRVEHCTGNTASVDRRIDIIITFVSLCFVFLKSMNLM